MRTVYRWVKVLSKATVNVYRVPESFHDVRATDYRTLKALPTPKLAFTGSPNRSTA